MDIEEFERQVKPRAKRSRLEPFQSQILALKGKGYTNWQIRDWLAANGVTVTQESVRKFIKARENNAINDEKLERVHASVSEKPAALPQETITPKKEIEIDDDLEHLSPADQRRIKNERKGDKYFSPQTTNSVLNNIVKNKGENK
jgi:hypothetical protein